MLVLKIHVYGIDKIVAVEKRPDRDFHAVNIFLQYEARGFLFHRFFVLHQKLHQIGTVFPLRNKYQPLVAGLMIARRLKNISIRIIFYKLDGFYIIIKIPNRRDFYAVFFQFRLTEASFYFQTIRVLASAYYKPVLAPQLFYVFS